jgi:peptide/nickel transport system substrate-binding protein
MVVAEGVSLTNAAGETVTFTGEPVIMPQMAVDFTMKQRYWSDGTPVTAADSVYSFGLAADPDTDTIKSTIERTISYEATGELSTRWMGVPGYLDSTFFTNFWQPLPKHAWGSYSAADLLDLVEVNRRPLGDGAFMIEEWVEGDHIRFVPNPFYYRADEGLPYLDSVIYKFIGDDNQLLTELIAGACDIATRGNLDSSHLQFLLEAEANGLLVTYTQIGTVFEHIDFGVNSYGDYGDDIGRPDWFEDVRVRQAITICTDRQRMVDEIFFGRTEILHTYIPGSHPLYAEGLTEWPYDVEQANALLDETGFLDADADGWREDPATGTPFRVTLYGMTDNEFRRQAVEIFKENMSACGIDVELILIPFSELVADGPEGVLFGRQFDLGIFAWLTGADPSCGLFTSNNITGSIEEGFGGWGNSNNTGWSNEAYDAACQQARSSLPGTAVYEASHKEAQRIFTQELPIIPLFINIKVAATRPEVLNFGVDPSQNSELYNIYQFDLQR